MGTTKFEIDQMHLRLSLFVLFFFWSAAGVFADNSKLESRIKKYVFEGCAKAEADTAKLSDADKRALVVFLGRVLELKLGGTTNVLQDAVKMSKPPSSIPVYNEGGELWRTFDPNHERQAKQCALKILSYVNRNALGELAKVLSYAVTYHETGAEREVEEIVSVARHILRKGIGVVSPDVEQRALLELFELRAETRFPLIDEFAAELATIHPNLLTEELMHSVRERRLYAVRLAAKLGLGSRDLGEQLLDLFREADLLKRRDIATMLAGFELDEIRLRFLIVVVEEMKRQVAPDGDILNSFGFAVKSLPKESMQKFTSADLASIESLFLTGKQVAVLEPLVIRLAEAGLLSAEKLRALAKSPDPSSRLAALSLIESSSAVDSEKIELYLLLLESWTTIASDLRPNGIALEVAHDLQHYGASLKQINRAITLLSAEIEALLKQGPQLIAPGHREQIEAVGMLGANAFRLIPKSIAVSNIPDLQEALALGLIANVKRDARSMAYIQQVAKANPRVSEALKGLSKN